MLNCGDVGPNCTQIVISMPAMDPSSPQLCFKLPAGSSSLWQKQTLGKSIFGWVVTGLSFNTVNNLIRPSVWKFPER